MISLNTPVNTNSFSRLSSDLNNRSFSEKLDALTALTLNRDSSATIYRHDIRAEPSLADAFSKVLTSPSVQANNRLNAYSSDQNVQDLGHKAVLTSSSSLKTEDRQQVSQKSDKELEERAQKAYKAMKGGLTGWGTDEKELFEALEGLNPAEVNRLKSIYKDRFNKDLQSDIKSELGGEDLNRALSLLESDQLQSKVQALHQAMDGAGTDEQAIKDIMHNLTDQERTQLQDRYRQTYGRELHDDLQSELSADEYNEVNALLKQDKESAAAARIHDAIEGVGTDEETIYKELEGKSPEEIQKIADAYQRMYGKPLEQDLEGDLSGSEKNRVIAALKGDNTQLAVEKLKNAIDGIGTDEDAINKVLESLSDSEREEVIKRYKQDTGRDLKGDLEKELSGAELEKSQILLEKGKLTDAEKIYFATKGIGTDEESVRKALEGKSQEEINAIKKEYKQKFGEDLEKVLKSELGGRDEFEAKQALKGAPQTLEEEFERLEERIKFEKSGIANGLCDALSSDDERMEENYRKAKKAYEEAKQDGTVSKEEEERIRQLLRYSSGDADLYKDAKQSVAETTATVAAVAAATTVVIATGGTATPFVLAAAAAAGGGGYLAGKAAVLGDAYDGQNAGADFAIGAVEGVVTVLTAGTAQVAKEAAKQAGKHSLASMARSAARKLGTELGRETAGGGLGGVVEAITKEETWKNGLGAAVSQIALGASIGAAGGAAGFKIGQGIGKSFSHIRKSGSDDVVSETIDRLAPVNHSPRNIPESIVPDRSSVTDELRGLQAGQQRTLGRGASDLCPDPTDLTVSRVHATVQRLPNGAFRVIDGIAPSASGIDIVRNGVRIRFENGMQVRPGDLLILGEKEFRIPDPKNFRNSLEREQFNRLEEKGQLIIGRGRGSDVNISDSSVSRLHATLESNPDGTIRLYDAKPSGNGVDYFDPVSRSWKQVSGQVDLPQGSFVRFGEHGKPFQLPETNTTHLSHNGTDFYLPDSIENLKWIDRFRENETIGGIDVFGYLDSKQWQSVENVIHSLTPDQRRLVREISFGDLGVQIRPNGSISPNAVFALPHQGHLIISPDALADERLLLNKIKKALEGLDDISDNTDFRNFHRLNQVHQDRPYTIRAKAISGEADKNGRIMYAGRPVIGRDTPINGGIVDRHVREGQFSLFKAFKDDRGLSGAKHHIGIIVDSSEDKYLRKSIDSFLQKPEVQAALRLPPGQREDSIFKLVFQDSVENLHYDLGCDIKVLKNLGLKPRQLAQNKITTLHLGDYLKAGQGVCHHQALYAGALMEELVNRRLINRNIKLSVDTNQVNSFGGGHAWLRIRLPDSLGGDIKVIDPAQKYVGSLWGEHQWVYQRPMEMPDNLMVREGLIQ